MKFIIYTPAYDENKGGSIALHKLCDVLRSQGHTAAIWYSEKLLPHEYINGRYYKMIKNKCRKILRARLSEAIKKKTSNEYEKRKSGEKSYVDPYRCPIAKRNDIKDSIVVYPEITLGNPLRAKRAVRWLLNKPGAVKGKIDFTGTELFFYYRKVFDDANFNPNPKNELFVAETKLGIYKQWNFGRRSGYGYMVRKGKERTLDYHPKSSVLLDNFEHHEMADMFNKLEYFVSYDLETYYSYYAAVCGCISVVVPLEGLSKFDWRPNEVERYGIAYGFEDIPWAVKTRDAQILKLKKMATYTEESVAKFVDQCKMYFG